MLDDLTDDGRALACHDRAPIRAGLVRDLLLGRHGELDPRGVRRAGQPRPVPRRGGRFREGELGAVRLPGAIRLANTGIGGDVHIVSAEVRNPSWATSPTRHCSPTSCGRAGFRGANEFARAAGETAPPSGWRPPVSKASSR